MDEPTTYRLDNLPDDERPLVAVVDCSVRPDDEGHIVYRDATPDEIAEAAAAESIVEAKPPLEQLADHLSTLPPDRVVTASDLLAFLRPVEATP